MKFVFILQMLLLLAIGGHATKLHVGSDKKYKQIKHALSDAKNGEKLS